MLLLALAATGCIGVTTSYGTTAPGESDGGSSGATSAGINTGLPCDVENLLQSLCVSCHSDPPSNGALMGLVTYADLTASAVSDPTKKLADLCVARMGDATRPMPPGSGATAAQIATLQAWVSAGYPQGNCGGSAGGGGAAYDTPVQCTSGLTWGGGEGSSLMNPGMACIACHSRGSGPRYTIAGTVYPTAHEPDLCEGASGITVVITDANGNTFSTHASNSSGNFSLGGAIALPYRAQVVNASGATRAMATPQTSGDCNSCHTVSGANGAPGRIMAP
jgi:hypothetical protein